MKRISLLAGFLWTTVVVFAQSIPNNSFENWVQYSAVGERPTDWSTLDSLTMALSGNVTHCAVKSTDARTGSYAIRMTTSSVTVFPFGTVIAPGAATNGRINATLASYTFDGGSPTTVRSKFFQGYYKYTPSSAIDGAVFTVALFRRNAITGNRDTIALGSDTLLGAVNTYTPFSVQLQYFDWVNNPDSCLILLQSSKAINDATLGVGSELFVDDLSFFGTVDIEEASSPVSEWSVYPSPASQDMTVDIRWKQRPSDVLMLVMDMTGKVVMRQPMTDDRMSMDVSVLPEGAYLITLIDGNGQELGTQRFTVAR